MFQQLKKEEISKLSRFLKDNDSKRKKQKLKVLATEIEKGYSFKIKKETRFIIKEKNKIKAQLLTTLFKNGFSLISDIVVSKETKESEFSELLESSIKFLISQNIDSLEIMAHQEFENIFKKKGFNKIGEKTNKNSKIIFFEYVLKKDVQSDLKTKVKDLEMMEEVSKRTFEKLRKV